MAELVNLSFTDIDICTQMYIETYAQSPWEETYDSLSINKYINSFVLHNDRFSMVLKEKGIIIGMVLGIRVPAPDGDFLRIEEICIRHSEQRKGYGTEFFRRLKEFIKESGMDSIALNTVRGYPAFSFYQKNGFQYIESSAFLFCTV